jgi:ABC-type lipoprotein release transport system permease subunit
MRECDQHQSLHSAVHPPQPSDVKQTSLAVVQSEAVYSVGQGLQLAGRGVVIGLAGSLAASGTIATLLFGVSRVDPITYVAMLLGASAIAGWVPARRAACVDPSVAFKAE